MVLVSEGEAKLGCLFEFVFELLLELILNIYLYLMTLIVPKENITLKTMKKIKVIVKVFAVILFVTLIVCLVLMFSDVHSLETIGKIMFFVSIGLIVAQVIAGIIIRVVSK